MNQLKIVNRTVLALSSMFISTLVMAGPNLLAGATVPPAQHLSVYPLTDNNELRDMLQEKETALYAIHSVNENGFASGAVDPVLLKLIAENPTDAQLLLLADTAVDSAGTATAFKK